jgi:hypothetical protein
MLKEWGTANNIVPFSRKNGGLYEPNFIDLRLQNSPLQKGGSVAVGVFYKAQPQPKINSRRFL